MALEKITQITGRGVPVPGDDIDTDRIIPARFMKCVTFDGLGEYLFYDVRMNEDGTERGHPLNEERFAGAGIIISGNNFGCGSSREHAPQAIYRAGFRAVIAEGFAEIFFGNSTQLGVPCVTASSDDLDTLRSAVNDDPSLEITIDVENKVIRFGGKSISCEIREGARNALVNGKWDPLQDLLNGAESVEAVAANLPYMAGK
ncbi:3-isopropylmalate dehydratase small subunit [Puniceicoccales bacterium CK1056]|uniref:3-isopropylmalate dehydratase n=1 Tax=Oceanipulchritudo coccoides TaxID=2706888 RepID=A0A6B2M4F0_9BACT|nr:3-isopropylmalate dehydratase small subunit [Oceanipulchritudo coccoides]NDV63226.1 3-isopropylmalate dehydratase small subunit [Oceanipulchritudo coccoides]